MHVAVFLRKGGADAAVSRKGGITVAQRGFANAHPGVAVAEDAAVLLVSRRVTGDLSKFRMVGGITGGEQVDAIGPHQPRPHAVERASRQAFLHADAGHDAKALRLDVDLALLTGFAAHGPAEGVVGAQEPGAVPSVFLHGLLHVGNSRFDLLAFGSLAIAAAKLRVFPAIKHEHGGDKYAFRLAAFKIGAGLKAFARLLGEAVEVKAVVPIGPADQRQAVGAEIGQGIAHAAAQVLKQGRFAARLVIEGHGFL